MEGNAGQRQWQDTAQDLDDQSDINQKTDDDKAHEI